MSELQAAAVTARNSAALRPGHLPQETHWTLPAIDEIAESADEFDNHFKVRIVDDSSRRVRASSLLQRRYAWRGYASSPLECSTSGRTTFTACIGDATVATITAGLDSSEGLFVAGLYPDEVQGLRDEGRKLCEFTKLAVDESIRSHAVLGAIFHAACIYAIDIHRCTDVLIEVNPRHVRFYQRMLGFQRVGAQRMDPKVNAPAVLLRLDLGHCAAEIARLGGRRSSQESQRSFYPFFFSPDEANRIVGRLRGH
jgi:hypothetical protein